MSSSDKELLTALYNALSARLDRKPAWVDDPEFNAYEWSGGNFDTAYQIGIDSGEYFFAQRLIKIIYEESQRDVKLG